MMILIEQILMKKIVIKKIKCRTFSEKYEKLLSLKAGKLHFLKYTFFLFLKKYLFFFVLEKIWVFEAWG